MFRYATLSAGLEAAREALSSREIALVQTTFVDHERGWLRLQSVLAHASGEWIAGDWPVGPLSLAQEPHRMGTALTYARRYALFALIGIAGDDDLDAPDLEITAVAGPALTPERGEEAAEVASPTTASPRPSDEAARVCERLIGEIARLASIEGLSRWAYRNLTEKNQLPRALAAAVERRFEEAMRRLRGETDEDVAASNFHDPVETHSLQEQAFGPAPLELVSTDVGEQANELTPTMAAHYANAN